MSVQKRHWKKILYENQGYPDNYTDISFLEQLKKNISIREYSIRDTVLGASRVTEQLCSVIMFSIIFCNLNNMWLEPDSLFVLNIIMTVTVYIFYNWFIQTVNLFENMLQDCKSAVKYLVLGYTVSPILQTLTDTISTDTIYAATVVMMLIHLVFFDYNVSAAIVSPSLSLNAAIFGSICLASRLPSPFHAFSLLTTSIQCFVLYPFLIYRFSNSFIFLTIVLIITIVNLFILSKILTIFLLLALLFINILCPILFIRWQKYKANIYGPWDEAVVADVDESSPPVNVNKEL